MCIVCDQIDELTELIGMTVSHQQTHYHGEGNLLPEVVVAACLNQIKYVLNETSTYDQKRRGDIEQHIVKVLFHPEGGAAQ